MECPALFQMEPIGVGGANEANGTVYHFCSEACRTACPLYYEDDMEAGTSVDAIDGTVCDECGVYIS